MLTAGPRHLYGTCRGMHTDCRLRSLLTADGCLRQVQKHAQLQMEGISTVARSNDPIKRLSACSIPLTVAAGGTARLGNCRDTRDGDVLESFKGLARLHGSSAFQLGKIIRLRCTTTLPREHLIS